MAAERISIISVRNDVVQVGLPFWDSSPRTYLTEEVDATGVALTVKDNSIFAENNYVVLGTPGTQQSEIKRISAAVTAGTSLTIAAATFSHPVATEVILSRYDQLEIYGSTTATDTSPTLIGSAVAIDVARGFTEIRPGTTYAYYYCRAKDSNAGTYSAYSDAVASTGLPPRARGEIKKEYLSMYNNTIDELITDDWVNRSINRWQRELAKRRQQWSCLRGSATTNSATDIQKYALPSDIVEPNGPDAIVSMKFYNYPPMGYMDQDLFVRMTADHIGTTLAADIALVDVTISLTDASNFPTSGSVNIEGDAIAYTSKTGNTLTGVTGITAIHTATKEVWGTSTTGTPTSYTIDSGYFKLFPIPNSAETGRGIFIEYWKKFTDLSDDADLTAFLWPENCLYYMWWQEAIRRRLPPEDQIARKREWQEDLESLVAQDPDFKDISIIPVEGNIYSNPY